MAGVVHHDELVGLVGDGLEQVGHLAVGDGPGPAAVIGQQGLDTAAGLLVLEAGAMAGVVDEDLVAVQHFIVERLDRSADVVAGGLLVLQVFDVAGWNLHGHRHLGGAFPVDVGARQGGNVGVGIAADADDERMAVGPRRDGAGNQRFRQAAHAQRECRVHGAGCLAAVVA